MKKSMLWPLIALVGGGAAFVLRLLQRSTGFEADTGLPIPGNLPAVLLVVWFVVLAAGCLLAARKLLPSDRESPARFPSDFATASAGLLTPAVMGIFLLAASGVVELASGVMPGPLAISADGLTAPLESGFFTQRESLLAGVLSLLSAASLFPAIPACRSREGDAPAKPFQGALLLVPVCCLVVRLVLTYRAMSVNPSLADYYPELLAVVFLTLAFYRLSSFAFRAGRSRRFALYAALAIAFCLATLADFPDPSRLLFYAGGALALFGFLLQRAAALEAPAGPV